MFTTERLRLRAYQPSDYERLYALFNHPLVVPWTSVDAYAVPKNEEGFKKGTLATILNSLMCCIAEEKETSSFVGVGILFSSAGPNPNRNITFGITLDPKHQNKGYGTEITKFMVDYAFHNLGMHRVSLAVLAGNENAIRVYEKIGFVEEARIRKYVWLEGKWNDRIKMGILEEEWFAREGQA